MRLSSVFSNGMVLQRDVPSVIWGWSRPGTRVDASIAHSKGSALSDRSGRWRIVLPAHAAGGPYALHVTSRAQSGVSEEKIVIDDVLFGDVWILAGQSNMQLWMGRLKTKYHDEIDMANDDGIRFFLVGESASPCEPSIDLPGGRWQVVGLDDITNLSGVGYFFARRIRKSQDVPLGLIQIAIGGTPIESWMSACRLKNLGYLQADPMDFPSKDGVTAFQQSEHDAVQKYRRSLDQADRGLAGNWYERDYDDSDWKPLALSQAWYLHDAFAGPGVVWMRCKVEVPPLYQGHPAVLDLGTLVDSDQCYVDGQLVGETGYRYPPRLYPVGHLGAQMQITVRLRIDTDQGGGWTPGKRHCLRIVDMDRAQIDLDASGSWRCRRGLWAPPAPIEHYPTRMPAACFNAMVAPLAGLQMSGVLWYQGESNASRSSEGYGRKLIGLIQDWRRLFHRPDLPFIYVQLPNLKIEGQQWPRLRDEQRKALVLDHTAMVVSCGLGEDNDLHPLNKKAVGERLAYAAQSIVYGADHPAMGPRISHAERREEGIVLHFAEAGSGLVTNGPLKFDLVDSSSGGVPESLRGIIASSDMILIPLDSDRALGNPVFVRYAWAHSPRLPLAGEDGLPVSPFEVPLDQILPSR